MLDRSSSMLMGYSKEQSSQQDMHWKCHLEYTKIGFSLSRHSQLICSRGKLTDLEFKTFAINLILINETSPFFRGVAEPDSSQPHGLRLLIEDYPFAVDGLEIWSAIETWVSEYCSFYYPTDDLIQGDNELQSWWHEVCNVGHGDRKDEPWWPEMQTRAELVQSCTIVIWVASALHAAVNFGQYPYAGYLPNRPTVSRRFMPEPGTPEYAELEKNPEVAFLKTITAQLQTLLGVSLIEILSRHSTDEVYLGQRDPGWTSDDEPLAAFERFRERLIKIEKKIIEMNDDKRWKNRVGPVNLPYTLLYPNTSDYSKEGGLTGKGIPNSISI